MLQPDEALAQAQALVAEAMAAGASSAEAIYRGDASTDIHMRLGELEDADRSESEELSLRLFVGNKSASVSSSSLHPQALTDLVERAVAMARHTPDDPYASLAPEELLLKGEPLDLDLDDGGDPAPERLRERALAAEDAARAVTGVSNSEGASASAGRTVAALATSHGFAAARTGSAYGCSASVLAGETGAMERDHASHSARHLTDLESAEEIGRRAGERAVSRLGGRTMKGGKMPVIYDPRVGGSLVAHLLGAISGAAIARRTSFLLDKEGDAIFPEGISIIDDPHLMRGLGSRPFDGEGLPTARSALVDKGIVTGWLCDVASANQLGRAPTGHAAFGGGGVSTSNVHMTAGELSPQELMSDIKEGVYLTELIGQGVNAVTGDYSRGASGFMIRDGEIAEPVNEITVAGNLLSMFMGLSAANDLELRHRVNVPTLRIDGMTVAGG